MINGGAFGQFEFFEEEGIGERTNAVELNNSVISTDCQDVIFNIYICADGSSFSVEVAKLLAFFSRPKDHSSVARHCNREGGFINLPDEDDFASMVGPDAGAISFNFNSFFFHLSSLGVILVLVGILFSLNIKRPQKAIFIGQKYFSEVVIIDSMNCFFLIFIILVQLEGLRQRILIKQFRVVFNEPLCSAIAVEYNGMFLGQDE